jgi:hypothetical protein
LISAAGRYGRGCLAPEQPTTPLEDLVEAWDRSPAAPTAGAHTKQLALATAASRWAGSGRFALRLGEER